MQRLLILSILLPWAAIHTAQAEQPDKRPNIVIILADDLGYSDIGCYGSEIKTPNLDYLAGQGIRLTQFYNAARCCPSRAALLTGVTPHQAGMASMADTHYTLPPYRGLLSHNVVTLGEVLGEAGYDTILSGKWHVGDEKPCWPCNRGFDRSFVLLGGASSYFNARPYRDERWLDICAFNDVTLLLNDKHYRPPLGGFYITDAFTDMAIGFLAEQKRSSRPFFLLLSYTAPHWPLHALPEDITKYEQRYRMGWDTIRRHRFQRMQELGIVDRDVTLPPRDGDVRSWDTLALDKQREYSRKMAVYAAMVDRMDQNIGRILSLLAKQGRINQTIVFFLSDNGACRSEGVPFTSHLNKRGPIGSEQSFSAYGKGWAHASNTPLRRYKAEVYEGGIATPFIACWPKLIQPNTINRSVGHIMDLMATCVDLAQAEYRHSYQGHAIAPLEGKSLVPILQGKTISRAQTLCWEHHGHRAVREGDWKLVSTPKGPWELFNLSQDPTEMIDLSQQHPDRVSALTQAYQSWAQTHGVVPWQDVQKYKIAPADYRRMKLSK